MFPDLKQSILWSEDLILIKCFGASFMCEVRLCEQHQNTTENRVLVTKTDTFAGNSSNQHYCIHITQASKRQNTLALS